MDKQINIIDLARLYMRRWWILLVGVVVGALMAFLYTVFFVTPMYVSAGTLYTKNTNDYVTKQVTDVNLSTLMVRKELVQTYAEVLTSNVFLKQVAEESGLGYTYDQILGMVSMHAKNNTEILVVRVKSPNPQHSYIIVQTLMNLADKQIMTVVEGGSVKILDEPEFPKTYSSPDFMKNMQVGAIVGLLLSAFVVFLIDFLDNKIKNAEQVAKLFGYPVLGEIPYVTRRKQKDANAPQTV